MYYRDDVRVAVLSSGGKDSTYASWWAIMQGWDVRALITVHVTSDDSMMFQLQNTSLAGLQAHSIGTSWLPVLSKGVEEIEIEDLENAIRYVKRKGLGVKVCDDQNKKDLAKLARAGFSYDISIIALNN